MALAFCVSRLGSWLEQAVNDASTGHLYFACAILVAVGLTMHGAFKRGRE